MWCGPTAQTASLQRTYSDSNVIFTFTILSGAVKPKNRCGEFWQWQQVAWWSKHFSPPLPGLPSQRSVPTPGACSAECSSCWATAPLTWGLLRAKMRAKIRNRGKSLRLLALSGVTKFHQTSVNLGDFTGFKLCIMHLSPSFSPQLAKRKP